MKIDLQNLDHSWLKDARKKRLDDKLQFIRDKNRARHRLQIKRQKKQATRGK